MRTTRMMGAAVALLSGAALMPTAARAQGPETPEPDGYTFYWPGSCVEGAKRAKQFYWRARQDSAAWTPASDTTLDDVKRVARECAAKMESGALVAHDLIPLGQVYLAAGDDARAKSLFDRRLAQADAQAPGPRGWFMAQIVEGLLAALPARTDAALAYIAQLDKVPGAEAAIGRVRAYDALAIYYRGMTNDASILKASDSLISSGKELSARDRIEF